MLQKLRLLSTLLVLTATVCLNACNNNTTDKPSDDTSTNIIEPTTPANDIPTPANDSLTLQNDSIKK